MSDEFLIEIIKEMNDSLHLLKRDIARLARDSYKKDLEKIANTPSRQEIWRFCDGTLTTEEIATRISVSLRTVQYFVQDAEKAGLLTAKKGGCPKRSESFDIIPTEWKPYKKQTNNIEQEKTGVETTDG